MSYFLPLFQNYIQNPGTAKSNEEKIQKDDTIILAFIKLVDVNKVCGANI